MRIKLIASIVTTAMLLLCGCKSGIDNENSHIQMSNAAQQIEQKTESNNKEENAIMNNIYIPHLKWGPRQSRSVT